MGNGYVLSIWERGAQPDDGGPPMRLSRYTIADEAGPAPELEQIATHDEGFDVSDIRLADDSVIDLATCLTESGLANKAHVAGIGEELWRRLTQGAIAAELHDHVFGERVHLDLRSHSLERYPWEFLRVDEDTPFTGLNAMWSLGRPDATSKNVAANESPLRIMVIVGDDSDDLQSEREIRHIESHVYRHGTEILLKALVQQPTAAIQRTLTTFKPHIVHFIGHAKLFGLAGQEQPELLLQQPAGEPERWDAKRIKYVFEAAPPRLVVLNACFTGSSKNRASSLPGAFLKAGSLAVVSMTDEILTDASAAFTKSFYEQLLDGVPIDRAVTYARRQILSIPATGEGVDKSRLENSWPLVRLTLHGQADHTIEMHCQCPRPRIWMDRHFVARWNERWDAWRAIDGTHSRLAVIGGPKKAGRTELLNCVAEICAHDGDAVVMVDLSTGPSGGWPDVLRAVASAADDHPDVDAATLTTIAAGDGERETVIGHFLTALETCSPGRRLVVAIDGLEDWSEDLVKQMIGDLCEPLVLPKAASNVRLVITLKSPLDNVDFGLDRAIWEPVTVGEFPEDEWARALPRYLDGLTDDEDARSKLEALVAGNLVVFGRSATTLEYARYGAKQLSRGQP